jgi:hypothetical protein
MWIETANQIQFGRQVLDVVRLVQAVAILLNFL